MTEHRPKTPESKTFGTTQPSYLLAFDTANEVVAIGVGSLDREHQAVQLVGSCELQAHRASNTQLLPQIDALITRPGIAKRDIACVVCGRGPGSFTGVRIAMATAKGIASALEVPLYGISTLDAIAWKLQASGVRGSLLVLADAMRKEVYPLRYQLGASSVERVDAESVIKADEAAARYAGPFDCVAGDALTKYAELFAACGSFADESLWTSTGEGLLRACEAVWRADLIDPFDAQRGNPAFALPIYTRLSDAEENERIRLSKNEPKNLRTGVQDLSVRRDQRPVPCNSAIANAQADDQGIVYRPLDAASAARVAALEQELMGSDAWNEALVIDELPRRDRVWWAAYAASPDQTTSLSDRETANDLVKALANAPANTHELIGYAGGWVVDGQLQVLKVGVSPTWQRRGVAHSLLAHLASDARDLGARECTLELRASNTGALVFYEALGLHAIGTRPRYYSDREDAIIMEGPLPLIRHDVAGMELETTVLAERSTSAPSAPSAFSAHPHPLILAIESSCDETAAAIIDGNGNLISNVVASQIDFHARFGGVVPEIASRKHIEAICGVTEECLDVAAQTLSLSNAAPNAALADQTPTSPKLAWRDLDAVAVTYAPGLVGALVVGVAFGKGAAWALDLPFIGVNHLEGHLYANRIATPDIKPPLVASLVSGGHTMLVHVKDWGDYETLGSTLDDAVGEAFDKVAKAMGLGYPGGPAISQLAAQGDPTAIDFPRAMLHSGDLSFSLSGLKTAVITYLHNEEAAGRAVNQADVAASFQQAVVDVQVAKAKAALERTGAREFCLGGGVAANPALREAYQNMCDQLGVRLTLPPLSACTDNAGMIALVALDRYRDRKFFGLDADAYAHTNLDDPY